MNEASITQALLEPEYLSTLRDSLARRLGQGEHLLLNFAAEQSQFIRFNAARIRQAGTIQDAVIELAFVLEGPGGALRRASRSFTLTGISYEDKSRAEQALDELKRETPGLPVDPYAQLPRDHGSSSHESPGALLDPEEAAETLARPIQGLDLAGIYASGRIVRAMANSAGLLHWFSTGTFSFDYSLFTPEQRAVKGSCAGDRWDEVRYRAEIEASRLKLGLLDRPAKRLDRGSYRAYLEPAAYADLARMLSWGAVSEASIRQGDSPLRFMRADLAAEGIRKMSPIFHLSEDFEGGQVPRFNGEGELAPLRLPLIERGVLRNTWVSSRSAREYGVPGNGANGAESLRASSIQGGSLDPRDVLRRLGTGVYLSNLHYLNWSDQPGGRITGMTRYACFWVEDGEITAPIENMRFDVSIYDVFGDALEDLTTEPVFLPEVGTYQMREPGGFRSPGALLRKMEFTI